MAGTDKPSYYYNSLCDAAERTSPTQAIRHAEIKTTLILTLILSKYVDSQSKCLLAIELTPERLHVLCKCFPILLLPSGGMFVVDGVWPWCDGNADHSIRQN